MAIHSEASDQRLSSNQRLKASRLFQEAFDGRIRASGRCMVFWLRCGPDASLRLGVVAGRKLGGAVMRNRAKRRLREVFRLNRNRFRSNIDVVLVAKHYVLTAPWAELQKELLALARKLDVLVCDSGLSP